MVSGCGAHAGRRHPRGAQARCILHRSPDTADAVDLRRFQPHRVEAGTGRVTINATLCGLRFFFEVAPQRKDAMAEVSSVPVPCTVPVVRGREQAARLLAATVNPEGTWLRCR